MKYSGLHPLQLHIYCQGTLCVEKPGTKVEYRMGILGCSTEHRHLGQVAEAKAFMGQEISECCVLGCPSKLLEPKWYGPGVF